MGSKTQKLHAYNTLKEARGLVFTAASAPKTKKTSFQIENTVSSAKFIYKLTSFYSNK